MYKVGILEDDAAQAEALARMLRECSFAAELELVGLPPEGASTPAGLDRFEDWAASLDVLFADIRLEGEENTGIDVVKKISELGICPQVIYVSGYLEYAPDVYRTDHVWFLAKPFTTAQLEEALGRAVERLAADRESALLVRVGPVLERILPSQIVYVESDRRKARIHLADGRLVETYVKLSVLDEKLPERFVPCHKSFLVNLDCVERLDSTELVLVGGTHLPVSQRCRKDLVSAFVARAGRAL